MVTLTEAEYLDRVHGGWLGKVIGATAGAPMDGDKGTHEVTGYPEALAAVRNVVMEGTDFQLTWLRALQGAGPGPSADALITAWLKHIVRADAEYGYARANFRRDVQAPVSGVFDNPFREGAGALARAELWGMVAPGDPEVAARYARQDAVLDHSGAGVEAAVLHAAVVSAAFVESEVPRLLEVGLSLIPSDSRVARAARDVIRWHGELANWRRTREMLLRAYAAEDVRDSTLAAGLMVLALLEGRGDFGRAVTSSASLGGCTKCTCGAVGAAMGVLLGAQGIPAAWRRPVRDEVRASGGLVALPRTAPGRILAQQTCEAGRLVVRSECAGRVQLSEEPGQEASQLAVGDTSGFVRQFSLGAYVTSHRRGQLEVQVDYDGRPTIGYQAPRALTIAVTNVGTRSIDLRARVSAPAGFIVATRSDQMALPESGTVSFAATVSVSGEQTRIAPSNPCTLFISVEGVGEYMVPIALVGEQLWYAAGPYGDFDQAHAPEQPGVLSGDAALGGEGWRALSVAEPAVNLLSGLEGEQGTYYLASDVMVPRPRRSRLRVGCNDATKVWLNGQQVFFQHEHRPVSPLGADEFEVGLREGWNRLVIKMAQCSPRRFLSAVFKDLDGHVLVEAVNTFSRHT
jgi:ADP-ribosylglycohydrolase